VFDGMTRALTVNACDCWLEHYECGVLCLFYLVKSLHRQASMRPALWMMVSPVLMHVLGTDNRMVQDTFSCANFKKLTYASVTEIRAKWRSF